MFERGPDTPLPLGQVAQAGCQDVEAVFDLLGDLLAGVHVHPACSQLNAQRHPLHQLTDVSDVGGFYLIGREAPIGPADVELEKEGPYVVTAGDRVTYTLTVHNYGPSDAQNVTVTDTLPAGVAVVPFSLPSGCNENPAGTVVCIAASLAAGASHSWVLTVDVLADAEPGTPLVNEAVA